MPEVNLLKDTLGPDQPAPKPRRPGEPEMTEPTDGGGGLGKFFKSFMGRPKAAPAPAESSRMGLGRKSPDQRIIKETRSTKPAMIPLPEDEEGLGVNLLADDLLTRFKPRESFLALGAWALGAVLLVGLAYGGLAWAGRSVTNQIEQSRKELQSVKAETAALDAEVAKVSDTTKKIAAIRSLIDRHIRWTKFFEKLESYTLPEVYYGTTFTGSIQGEFSLSATTDSFERVAKQYLVYQEAVRRGDFLSKFDISGATRVVKNESTAINFTVNLSVLPNTFLNEFDQVLGSIQAPVVAVLQGTRPGYVLACYLIDHSDRIDSLPDFTRQPFRQLIGSRTREQLCQTVSQSELQTVAADLPIDDDRDGLNRYFEDQMGTNDQLTDSDADGTLDYQMASQNWQQAENQPTNQ